MKIAAYQAPLLPSGSFAAIELIRRRVEWCAAAGVGVLLCPEAVLGGLADDARDPAEIAIRVNDGALGRCLAPLFSDTVTTIVGFTELAGDHDLFNSAAIFSQGQVIGVYRKRHPARRSSVYRPGSESPIFKIDGLCFGIMICNDTNFPDLGAGLAARGANVLLVPSNNALKREFADVVSETRAVDVACAMRTGLPVIRADVAGNLGDRRAFGSSIIVDRDGTILRTGQPFVDDLLVAELEVGTHTPFRTSVRDWTDPHQ